MILSERPYLPVGTLRELLVPQRTDSPVVDEQLTAILRRFRLDDVVARAGGLDTEHAWDAVISLGELQLLSVARLLVHAPRFALLHRIDTTLGSEHVDEVLRALTERGITYVTFERSADLRDRHDAVLELAADGGWTWTPRR